MRLMFRSADVNIYIVVWYICVYSYIPKFVYFICIRNRDRPFSRCVESYDMTARIHGNNIYMVYACCCYCDLAYTYTFVYDGRFIYTLFATSRIFFLFISFISINIVYLLARKREARTCVTIFFFIKCLHIRICCQWLV